jgi:prepilin-type N-terminal cleavage/methylation domain-containing protein
MRRQGFSLVELVVSLALFGGFAGALYATLTGMHRMYRRLTVQTELQVTLRGAAEILAQELRGLDTADSAGSDLLDPGDAWVIHRAMRSVYAACAPPLTGALVLDTSWAGLRPLDPEQDSVLVLAGATRWLHADVVSAISGNDCPGGGPSLRLTLRPPLAGADSVVAGSPVRAFEVVEWRAYRDAAGDTWLGQRRHQKRLGWSTFQPVTGPLRQPGLAFSYHGADGAPADPTGPGVARITVTIVATSLDRRTVDSVVTHVALRNSRH